MGEFTKKYSLLISFVSSKKIFSNHLHRLFIYFYFIKICPSEIEMMAVVKNPLFLRIIRLRTFTKLNDVLKILSMVLYLFF